jgi:cyclic pyranopterin phosphate synthase
MTTTEAASGSGTNQAVPVGISVRPHTFDRARLDVVKMPTAGPLVDRYGRVHTDMRISVTDRCNLRCVYCMPEFGLKFMPREELLNFEEIARVARVAHELGITSIRLTGGEPLVRKDLPLLVEMLGAIGFGDIALTTNGTELRRLAPRLADAGLTRVNISCDSLDPMRFAEIRRRGDLLTVLDAMAAAEEAGLGPVKINVVLLRGRNDGEILDFARLARESRRVVRFIEFMPLDAVGEWQRDQLISGKEVFDRISAVWPLSPVSDPNDPAPAQRFAFDDGQGEIGLISSVTDSFCGTCNRLRLTADGSIRNCLFSDDERSIRGILRDGGSDEEITRQFRVAVWDKFPGHGINDPGFLAPARSMSMIGG